MAILQWNSVIENKLLPEIEKKLKFFFKVANIAIFEIMLLFK